MTREELKAHCEKQIEMCEMLAFAKGKKPSGKIYEEHMLILELLEQKPHCIATVTLNEEKMRELCHKAAQELSERIDEAFKNRENARKVLYSGDGFADGHMVYDMAECPACGKKFEEDYSGWLDPYCSHCGQKLDWSFEEIEEEAAMNNTICRNFDYNEKAGGILELISLNCKECEFDGHCDIKSAYEDAKDYAASIEFVEDIAESEVKND